MFFSAIIATVIGSTEHCDAMTFRVVGSDIFSEGTVIDGDAEKFFRGQGASIVSDVDIQFTMHLNSAGGSLLEGVRLGLALHERGIATKVGNGSQCYSACAIAFLGGTLQYATGTGPGREIEWGAQLGFHGYFMSDDFVEFANETLSSSRIINALLLSYAQEVGNVDFQWLAEALTYPPNNLLFVNTRRSMSALSIMLSGGPTSVPENWDRPICSDFVKAIEIDDDWGYDRTSDAYRVLERISIIRELTASVVFEGLPNAVDRLDNDTAISLALGGGFNIENYKPIIETRQRGVERGGGFYYDYCVSLRSATKAVAILVDSIGKTTVWKSVRTSESRIEGGNGVITMYPADVALWENP
jgi:hypothetical protein